MEIIDAQIHQPAPWLAESEADTERESRLATEIALAYMDAAGVDRAVLSANAKEWGWAEFVTVSAPERLAVTASNHFDPEAPDIEEKLAELKSNPSLIGYRQAVNYPPGAAEKVQDGRFDRLFSACAKLGLPVMVLALGDARLVDGIARSNPDLSLIVDHLGVPQPPGLPPAFLEADNPPFKSLPQVLDLAKYENVSVKFSGAPALSTAPYPFDDLWPHLSQLVEAFGPDRLMWGTDIMRVTGRVAHKPWKIDFPGLHSYAEAVGFLRDTDRLSESDKEQMFAGTLRRILGWPTTVS